MIEKIVEQYANEHTSEEDKILYDINRKTHLEVLRPIMLSGHYQGKFFEMISYMIQAESILEIGTYTAYASICLARGLKENGQLITIEHNPELEEIIKNNIEKAGLSNKIKYIIGDAKKIIPSLKNKFDIVFIDAEKELNQWFYDNILPKVRKNGIIIIDNALWYGKVVGKIDSKDKKTQAIHKFNKYVMQDKRVENILLTIRDGLMIIRKL